MATMRTTEGENKDNPDKTAGPEDEEDEKDTNQPGDEAPESPEAPTQDNKAGWRIPEPGTRTGLVRLPNQIIGNAR